MSPVVSHLSARLPTSQTNSPASLVCATEQSDSVPAPVSPVYTPTSPRYSHTSPQQRTTSPGYQIAGADLSFASTATFCDTVTAARNQLMQSNFNNGMMAASQSAPSPTPQPTGPPPLPTLAARPRAALLGSSPDVLAPSMLDLPSRLNLKRTVPKTKKGITVTKTGDVVKKPIVPGPRRRVYPAIRFSLQEAIDDPDTIVVTQRAPKEVVKKKSVATKKIARFKEPVSTVIPLHPGEQATEDDNEDHDGTSREEADQPEEEPEILPPRKRRATKSAMKAPPLSSQIVNAPQEPQSSTGLPTEETGPEQAQKQATTLSNLLQLFNVRDGESQKLSSASPTKSPQNAMSADESSDLEVVLPQDSAMTMRGKDGPVQEAVIDPAILSTDVAEHGDVVVADLVVTGPRERRRTTRFEERPEWYNSKPLKSVG